MSATHFAPRNVLLYWDKSPPPPGIEAVRARWHALPNYRIYHHDFNSAAQYISDNYSGSILSLFKQCKIPAMQSDFFRVLWTLKEGGLYCDYNFVPHSAPDVMFNQQYELTCVRWPHGRIVNGIFRADPDATILQKILDQIIYNIAHRVSNNVWVVSGPGAWINVMNQTPEKKIDVITRSDLLKTWAELARHRHSGRGSHAHWSKLQETSSIFGS